MSKLQPVRGTHDLPADAMRRHRRVVEGARVLAERYGFGEVATPIFEFAEVFQRTLGETSDVVTKEMYTFDDRSGARLTLRPENTAGVARALISGGLGGQVPLKCFYAGPMFRYERPQKGRLRQFHQIGVELMGVPEPIADIEVIALGAHILEDLGVLKDTTLELNTLGDRESRTAYREALVAFLSAHEASLSEESRERLARNPMRVLDSKNPADKAIVAEAPTIDDCLTDGAAQFFDAVKAGLDRLGVAYERNPRLVRGLDYYCHTAFEFTTRALGAQGAVMAGGRYDGLVESMGGQPTPGVGWAAGIERLALLADDQTAAPRPIAIVPVGARGEDEALLIADRLRRAGLTVELTYRGNMSKRMKRASQAAAVAVIMIGDDEIEKGVATVRELDTGEQQEVAMGELVTYARRYQDAGT